MECEWPEQQLRWNKPFSFDIAFGYGALLQQKSQLRQVFQLGHITPFLVFLENFYTDT